MGKFKMPTVEEFMAKKKMYEDKKDPPWVFLEREMIANLDKKPYNEKVGDWLKFLKDLKLHYHNEGRRKKKRLQREAGPNWFCQLSNQQRLILRNLKKNIHQDILEDRPVRIRKALFDLGMDIKICNKVLMDSMIKSIEDPGMFIWELYTQIYKMTPAERRPKYDMNGVILMSSLVFIDLDECIKLLETMTHYKAPPPKPPKIKPPKKKPPYTRYGEYLDKMEAVCYMREPDKPKKKPGPKPLGYKFKLRTEESYEALRNHPGFLKKRKDKAAIRTKPEDRECHYKFWEPPSTLRNTDPKMAAYVNKLKMMKMKAKAKYKAPYKNVQYLVGGVSFTGDHPHYILQNVSLLPTGFIPLNGGIVVMEGECITNIQGFWKYPRNIREKCDLTCDCLTKWESKVMDYVKETKCKCRHLYDFKREGKPKEKYFYPPTRNAPFWIDHAKVNQLDPMEDFVKDTAKDALMSQEPTPEESMATISAATLKPKELLGALLADLTGTTLIIPHLPDANLLPNLQEWVRKRVKGKINSKQHQHYKLVSQRRWLDLKHIDFKALAYRIPFTYKELEEMNWDQRKNVQKLFKKLLLDFVTRNRQKQLEQTRLWWSTTKSYAYPSPAFLDVFFTYMPSRMQDTFLINPYSSGTTPKYGAKTCPIYW